MDTEKDKKRKSLRYSVYDGIFYSIMAGFGESFFIPFAVFLKASALQIGLINSLPQAIGSLGQLFSEKLVSILKTRKKTVYIFAFIQGLMLLPIPFIHFWKGNSANLLLFFVCLYWLSILLLIPAWYSWMGDLVDDNERGSYFGKRNKYAGVATFFAFITAGSILQYFTRHNNEYSGYLLLFILAFGARMFSVYYLNRQYEPEYQALNDKNPGIIDFIGSARKSNFGLFVFYLCIMNFACSMAGPFVTPYVLEDLHYDYKIFTVIMAAPMLARLFSMPMWGILCDKYGTKKIMTLSGFLMPVVPLLWMFSGNVWYLVIMQCYSGFTWAGWEISSFNYTFDATTPKNRTAFVAYFNVLNGISMLAGSLAGGLIIKWNSVFWSPYLLVFLISCVIRYGASAIFLPKLHEDRCVECITYRRLFMRAFALEGTAGMFINLFGLNGKNRDSEK